MNRLRLLFAALVLLSNSLVQAADEKRQNVLFIMADDLRTELATYGSAALTPNLDRLAGRAVQFDRAYCQQALCNPSRSSLLTGRRPDSLGLWCNSIHFRELQPNVTTLPLWFKEQGYQTRCVGKIFHNWHTAVKGDPRAWSQPEFLHYANHNEDHPQVTGPLPPNQATAPKCECREVPDEAYYDGRVAAEAVRVLSELKDKSFFLAVGFWKPHSPFNAPKKYWDKYDRSKLPALNPAPPAGVPPVALHDGREIRGVPPNQLTFSPEQAAEIRHGYYANIAYMDAQVGKVLDALEKSGAADRTIVVFVADHGYHIGEHTLWGKTSNFEYDARVPLLIALPATKPGRRTEALVELIDLFPTLVAQCGLPQPEGLGGTNLTAVLTNPAAHGKSVAFTQHPRPQYFDREPSMTPEAMGYSVRTADVRYTEWRDWKTGQLVGLELYDAQRDPAELHNAIDDPALASAQQKAAAQLAKQFPATPH